MYTDEEMLSVISKASEIALLLKANGGRCDVSGEPNNALFTVTMKDGRVFEGCGIHGAGGSLRGESALVRAQKQVFNQHFAERYPDVRIYLVDRWFGNESVYVPREEVVKIELFC